MNRHQRRTAEAIRGAQDPNSKPDEYAQRLHMISHNEQAIQVLLGRYFETGGDPDVAVLLVDFRDSVGSEIAAIVDPDGHADRIAGLHQIPTGIIVVSRPQAAKGFQVGHPRTAAQLRTRLAPGFIHVACIGFGGATLVGMPLRPMTAAASA